MLWNIFKSSSDQKSLNQKYSEFIIFRNKNETGRDKLKVTQGVMRQKFWYISKAITFFPGKNSIS